MTAARDKAFGRYYAKRGLRVGRSDIPPEPADRYSSWAAQYFKQPAHMRNPPSRIELPEKTMSAVILPFFSSMRHESPEQIKAQRLKVIREDVRNALPGFDPMRVSQAQARAERNLRNGVPIGICIDRAIAWARCATDPTPPVAA